MIALVAALMMQAAAAEAPPAPATPAPVEKTAAADPAKAKSNDLVCWDETPTGTRFSHKVCSTRDQLDRRRQNDQDWKMRQQALPPQGGN